MKPKASRIIGPNTHQSPRCVEIVEEDGKKKAFMEINI